ncbi:MAG TPA: HAD family phosphatase [Prolixibacteraceae bacterium]|nr:HAD family phosphatase [Prolixibacteraceae bacterium]
MEVAVIFDMDGVIVDNGKYHQKAWEEFCVRHKISFSEEKFKNKYFGRTNNQVLPELFDKDLSENEVKQLADEKEKIYRCIYKPHLKAVSGLHEFLEELKTNNIPVAVATSAPQENVDFVLKGLKIDKYIQQVVTDAMVLRGKPHPEIYLKAAEMLNVAPPLCVVFEDSLSGTKSAYDSGAKVVAVTTTLPAEKHTHAHKIIVDFTSVNLRIVRQIVS